MHKKIIAALRKILVEADFKAVEKKFVSTTRDQALVKDYLDKFKKYRNSHRITETSKKDIDYWGKQGFGKFKAFIDILDKTKSKTQTKKDIRKVGQDIEGAELIAENDDWIVYRIDTYEASKTLGSRNWCIVREEEHWDTYTKGKPTYAFYYLIKKNPDPTSQKPRYCGDKDYTKIAFGVENDGDFSFWDFNDKEFNLLPEEAKRLNIPSFEAPPPEYLCGDCGLPRSSCDCSRCEECHELVYNKNDNDEYCTCDRCDNCNELMRNCRCDRCEDCSELIDDCECVRCEECNDILDYCECDRCDECYELIDECKCEKKESTNV